MRTLQLLAAAVTLLVGCSESPESLERRVEDEAGVLEVTVGEHTGDDDVPFAPCRSTCWS